MTNSYNFFNLRAFSEADQPYACNDWVVFQEKAYKSRKPNNNRYPHDSECWDEIGLVSGLLDHLLSDNRAIDLSVAFYPECSNGCVAMFDKGGCVIDKVPVLNEDGTQKKDDCGQSVFELMIFTSLVDCNTDAPQEGASKEEQTWDGGYTVCAYLNRPVAYTQDANEPDNWLKPEAPRNLKCVLDCSAPDGETIALATKGTEGTHSTTPGNKLRVIHDNESIVTTPDKGLEVAVIGKDMAGQPVDVRNGPCFVTCATMGDGLTWDATAKKWIANLGKGVKFVQSKIQAAISNGLAFNGDNEIVAKAGNPSIVVDGDGIKVGVIGVDRNGQPVNAGACLVTCSTDLHVIAINDAGTDTVITLSDGTVISGPEIDKDDYVVSYVKTTNAAGESILTITMKSGATHQVTLPAGTASSITDLTNTPNYEAGTIQVNSSDGADTVLDITSPDMWPAAWVRAGGFTTEGGSGVKPPGQAIIDDNLSGGFSYDAAGNLIIPKTGRWDTDFLVASIAQETKLYTGNQQLKIGLTINDVVVAARQQDDYTGHHSGEENVRPRIPILNLNKGDKVSVLTTEESPENRMVTYDIKLVFISSLGN